MLFVVPFSNESIAFHTVEELKRAIITEWQRFIDSSINECRRRLECVVKNGGGHIEHCNLY